MAKAGINASVSSAGDAYYKALAETNYGLYKAEPICVKPVVQSVIRAGSRPNTIVFAAIEMPVPQIKIPR